MIGFPFFLRIHDRIDFLAQLAAKQNKRIAYVVVIRLRQLFLIEDEKNVPIRMVMRCPSCSRAK